MREYNIILFFNNQNVFFSINLRAWGKSESIVITY